MHIINDRFGYAVGDKVIAALGRMICKAFRNAALTGRVAGDRFAVILENLDDTQIEKLALQLVQDFNQIQQFSPSGPFRATLSVSFAAYNNKMDLKAWMTAAERLLAEAKENGGNQVRTANSSVDWSKMRR